MQALLESMHFLEVQFNGNKKIWLVRTITAAEKQRLARSCEFVSNIKAPLLLAGSLLQIFVSTIDALLYYDITCHFSLLSEMHFAAAVFQVGIQSSGWQHPSWKNIRLANMEFSYMRSYAFSEAHTCCLKAMHSCTASKRCQYVPQNTASYRLSCTASMWCREASIRAHAVRQICNHVCLAKLPLRFFINRYLKWFRTMNTANWGIQRLAHVQTIRKYPLETVCTFSS